LQNKSSKKPAKTDKARLSMLLAGFLLDLLLSPEDEGEMFLRSVGRSLDYVLLTSHRTVLFIVATVRI
jgi:hypothetical protein